MEATNAALSVNVTVDNPPSQANAIPALTPPALIIVTLLTFLLLLIFIIWRNRRQHSKTA